MSRNATAAARRTRCSTASVPTRTGVAGTGDSTPAPARTSHLPHVGAQEGDQLLAQTAHAGAQGLHAQPAARRAHDRPGLVAARAPQDLLPAWLRRRRTAAGTPGQLAAVSAGQQTGAPGAVVDADQRAARTRRGVLEHRAGQADELLREHAAARVGATAIDPLQDRPSRPFLQTPGGDGPQPGPGGQRHRRHGRDEKARNAVASRALDQEVDRAVRRGAFLPVGGVVGIEDDDGRQLGHGGPGAGAVADHDGPTGACVLPGARGRAPPAFQPCRQSVRPSGRRDEHQHAAGAGAHARIPHDGQHQPHRVGQRGLAHDGDSRLRQVEIDRRGVTGCPRWRRHERVRFRARGCGHGAHDGLGRRDAEEERGRTGPTPRGPLRQLHEAGRWPPAQPRLERQEVDAGRRPDLLVDHPAPHGPPVEGCPHARADLHRVVPARGNGVVERLGHGGHLGAHAHHTGRRRRPRRPVS